MDDATPEDLPEELELEIFAVQSLAPELRRQAVEDLCARHPRYAESIRLVAQVADLTSGVGRVVRVGDYAVQRILGEGGMGRVYLAQHDDDDREVALKIVRPEHSGEELLRRLRREAAVLDELRHRAIARYFDSGEGIVEDESGARYRAPYLAMEYVDGRDLLRYASEEALGIEDRLRLAVELCEGLAHAHDRGVVHRDLKPGNILVAENEHLGQPKLLDFGIARATDLSADSLSLTVTGQKGLLGTAPYMSPEQVAGGAKGLDAQSDVYSLGVVIFELFVGHLPHDFATDSLPEIARVIRDEVPKRLGAVEPEFRGKPIELVLEKALERDRRHRYLDARALGADLTLILQGRPITARPPSLRRRAMRFASQHKVVVGVMAALVAGSISTAVFAWQATRAKDLAERTADRANLAAAEFALDRYEISNAAFHLDQIPERRRGWVWRHLSCRLDDSELVIPLDQGGPIEFHPDGKSLFVLSGDDQRLPWELRRLAVPSGEVLQRRTLSAGFYTLDRGRLVSATEAADRSVTARFEPLIPGLAERGLGLGPGEWFAPGSSAEDAPPVMILRHTGKVAVGRGSAMRKLEFPGEIDGRVALGQNASGLLVAQSDYHLEWWPLVQGGHKVTLESDLRRIARGVTVTRDGKTFAVGDETGAVTLWQSRTPVPVRQRKLVGHRDSVAALDFSIDGSRLASGGEDRVVRLWNVGKAELIAEMLGHSSEVGQVALSADGRWIASRAGDGLRFWWSGAKTLRELRHETPVTAILGPHGRRIYAGEYSGRIRVYDATSSAVVAEWRPKWMRANLPFRGLSVGGRWLAIAASKEVGGIGVVDLDSGDLVKRLPAESERAVDWRVAVAPDGRRVVAIGRGYGIRAWSTEDWSVVAKTVEKPRGALVVLFSPDGRYLATSRAGDDIVIRDPEDLTVTRTLRGTGRVRQVAFSADGKRLATASTDGIVRVFDVASGAEHIALIPPAREASRAMTAAFSPDGRRIASADFAGTIHIWDAADGTRLASFRYHSDFVLGLCFSHDGKTLFSSAADGAVRVLDTEPLRVRAHARRDYRVQADRLVPVVDEQFRKRGARAAARQIAQRADWSDREREIAAQLLLGRALATPR